MKPSPSIQVGDGRRRVIIESVSPEVNAGRFAIKRTVGERVIVEADIFCDSHDVLSAVVKYRHETTGEWSEAPMQALVNDRWRGEFVVNELGYYFYTIEAWADRFKSWRRDFQKKVEAHQDVLVDVQIGAKLIEQAAQRAEKSGAKNKAVAQSLDAWAKELASAKRADASAVTKAWDESLATITNQFPDRSLASIYERELRLHVDPERSRFSSWYELFPRSFAKESGKHGTFADCEAQLPRIAEMGFDVLYFPPIHPIGRTERKGKNNNPKCQPGEPGSPWAIGGSKGGHKAVNPDLGTLADFRRLVNKAREFNIETALDIAFQCSPDHPYVKEHPEWFRHNPDGSIQYAENPPKKYQDIYPFDFETDAWESLWLELKSVFEFWIEQGIRIFRVDNPHTKAFPFWEWCIGELKREHVDLIFLAEAFTRPKVMYRLAKLGFVQSYNYFPWRNTKDEITGYFTELTRSAVAEFFRPNLWPNTPDILPQYLQVGGRAAFATRLVLAATLGASYGIYGPAFELCENEAISFGSEEYANSEKYEIRRWDLNSPNNLSPLIAKVNRIRRENRALQFNHRLTFHPVSDDNLIAYTKSLDDGTDAILTVVNLDPHHTHWGWVDLPLEQFNLDPGKAYQMHDLLTEARYLWKGGRNYVELNPMFASAHIFRLRHHVRTERDFDYFM